MGHKSNSALYETGMEARHIIAVTHHCSTVSLSSYSRVPEDRIKNMSSVMSTALTGKPTSSDRPTPAAASATSPLPVLYPAPVLP